MFRVLIFQIVLLHNTPQVSTTHWAVRVPSDMFVISGVRDLWVLSDWKSGVLRFVMSGIVLLDMIITERLFSGVAQRESRVSVDSVTWKTIFHLGQPGGIQVTWWCWSNLLPEIKSYYHWNTFSTFRRTVGGLTFPQQLIIKQTSSAQLTICWKNTIHQVTNNKLGEEKTLLLLFFL